jgi:hypothetical protein
MKTSRCIRSFSSISAVFLRMPTIVLLCLSAGSAFAQNPGREPTSELIPCGKFSSVFLRPQVTRYAEQPPPHISLMPARWSALQMSLAGYQRTGIRLVAWDGSRLVPAEYKDDSGFDFFIPQLASFFRLSLAEGVDLFIGGILISCYSLGLIGLLLLLKSWWVRCFAIFEVLLLAALCLRIGDVYVVQSSIAMVIIPWVLYFSKKWQSGLQFPLFLIVGVALGISNFVRAQAGTTVLLFCIPVLAFYGESSRTRRVLLLASLLAGVAASTLYFRHAFVVRDAYIQGHQSDYLAAPRQHPIWHSVYIGLGFVSNPYVPGGYCDQVGIDKVRSLSPTTAFLSPEYDQILAQQVYELAKSHPSVLMINLAAKLGILQLLALLAGNIGLLAAIGYRKPLVLDAAFWAAVGFGGLPGLLAVPVPSYVLGAITVLVLYGLVSIDHALEEGAGRTWSGVFASRGKAVCAV